MISRKKFDQLVAEFRHQDETGGWQLGDVDLGEHLEKYRDRKVVLIIASAGRVGKEAAPTNTFLLGRSALSYENQFRRNPQTR